MAQNKGPLCDLKRHILMLSRMMKLKSAVDSILRPCRLPELDEFGPSILRTFRQTLSQWFRQVRSGCYQETSIVDKGIFEGVPECQGARGICETAASVLVRVDTAADASGFGDELTLCDQRNGAIQGVGDGAVER